MAEIAETVKVPVFTFNEVVYTCAGYSFFFLCRALLTLTLTFSWSSELLVKLLSEASGGCGIVKMTQA